MKRWIAKSPPKPFYGPEEYYPGMDVEEATTAADEAILRWEKAYCDLSFWDRLRLTFSSEGIFYNG